MQIYTFASTPESSATRQGAFTLVEAMVGIFIMALVSLSAVACLLTSTRIHECNQDNSKAIQLLQSEVETTRAMRWSQIDALPVDRFTKVATDEHATSMSGEQITMERLIEVQEEGIKKITLRATWTNSQKQERDMSVNFLYTENGISDALFREYSENG